MDSVKLVSVSPILKVHDLSQAIDFYRHTLGFDLAWSWGSPPDIAAVCRDNVEIMLTQRADTKPAEASHIYLNITGIDDYYAMLERAGVTMLVPIGDRPYGMRDFRIADPSGNELSMGQPDAGS
jgi:predicted enzyme related to lactoylglutathione lyase